MLMIHLDGLLAIVHEFIKMDISCAPLKIQFGEPPLCSFPFYPVAKITGILKKNYRLHIKYIPLFNFLLVPCIA